MPVNQGVNMVRVQTHFFFKGQPLKGGRLNAQKTNLSRIFWIHIQVQHENKRKRKRLSEDEK